MSQQCGGMRSSCHLCKSMKDIHLYNLLKKFQVFFIIEFIFVSLLILISSFNFHLILGFQVYINTDVIITTIITVIISGIVITFVITTTIIVIMIHIIRVILSLSGREKFKVFLDSELTLYLTVIVGSIHIDTSIILVTLRKPSTIRH